MNANLSYHIHLEIGKDNSKEHNYKTLKNKLFAKRNHAM